MHARVADDEAPHAPFLDVLHAVRHVEQQFGMGVEAMVVGIQQYRPHLATKIGAAGFAAAYAAGEWGEVNGRAGLSLRWLYGGLQINVLAMLLLL